MAITNRTYVVFNYNGVQRKVAVHVVGYNYDGNAAIRGFQEYNSATGMHSGFKLFLVANITALAIQHDDAFIRKPEYKKNDSYFRTIISQL